MPSGSQPSGSIPQASRISAEGDREHGAANEGAGEPTAPSNGRFPEVVINHGNSANSTSDYGNYTRKFSHADVADEATSGSAKGSEPAACTSCRAGGTSILAISSGSAITDDTAGWYAN